MLFLSKTSGIAMRHKILLIVVLASTLLLMGDRIDVERYLTLTDISADYNVSGKGGRLELWEAAIQLSLANPFTGVGVECFGWAHYLDRVAIKDDYLRYHAVHNSYLQISAEVGLIGFGVYVLIIVRSLLTFLRMSGSQTQPRTREIDQMTALGGLMLLGFVGLLVAGFFLSHGYSTLMTLYFALAAVMARLEAGAKSSIGARHGAADTTAAAGWRNSG
jgi:O-antigen ligase